MPYKDPERKRQWEREHRKQRNEMRRKQHLVARADSSLQNPQLNRSSVHDYKSGWSTILCLAMGFGVVLVTALGALNGSLEDVD